MPLPPIPPMALKADTAGLDFHLSPLLKTGGLAIQIRRSLNDLLHETHGETIVKLRGFVAGAGDARRLQAEVAQIFGEHKLPLPVLSVLQVGALAESTAQVEIEAVVATRRTNNPQGLAFFAGQPGGNLTQALDRLKESVRAAGVSPDHLLLATCFTARLDDYQAARASAAALFPKAFINLVQAIRDPLTDESTCEAIGQLSEAPAGGSLVLLKQHRAALVNTPQLVFTGLQLSFGNYLDDAHEAFVRLQRSAAALRPVETPLLVNVFSLDPSGGSALRKTASAPPSTFTVQTIEGLPAIDASAGIEAVLAPDVETPVAR